MILFIILLIILLSAILVMVTILTLAGYSGCAGGGPTSTGAANPTASPTAAPTTSPTASPSVTTLSYANDIQPIWSANCATCHVGGGNSGGLQLDSSVSYDELLARNNRGSDHGPLVVASNAAVSILIQKLEGNQTFGTQMPQGRTPLSTATIQKIKDWIIQGAQNN